jgi:putative transposase
VISRGNGRMQIFLEDFDYRKFLYILGDVVDLYDVECWDFCLMPNHYHLALCNRKPNLSEAIQHLNGVYALWWNATHRKVGHVFQGRYKDQIVQHDEYLLSLVRYIALNPVRAKLVHDPAEWQWSSYGCIAGLRPMPAFLSADPILKTFGEADLPSLRDRYRRHVMAFSEDEEIKAERFRSRERVLGDKAFKRSILVDDCRENDGVSPQAPPVPMDARAKSDSTATLG